jgi:uncharacterized protein (UPF0332 family)
MPFDPQQFGILGQELANGNLAADPGGSAASPEAQTRTAFGRAYYCLFLAVRAVLTSKYHVPAKRVEHGLLYNTLQSSSLDARVRAIGKELERLYKFRRHADYEMELDPKDAERISNRELAALTARQAGAYAGELDSLDFSPIIHRFR